jgi:hypothetical protein
MEALMVLKGIGAPDVVREVPPAMTARWEYDMDGADPFTLVIEWQDGKAVRVERQRPVAWRDGLVRDESLCKD